MTLCIGNPNKSSKKKRHEHTRRGPARFDLGTTTQCTAARTSTTTGTGGAIGENRYGKEEVEERKRGNTEALKQRKQKPNTSTFTHGVYVSHLKSPMENWWNYTKVVRDLCTQPAGLVFVSRPA